MKVSVLCAANTLKGCLPGGVASKCIADGVREAFSLFKRLENRDIKYNIVTQPIADGGDDTVDILSDKTFYSRVKGPLNDTVEAKWGSRGNTAIIEMSKCSGICLIKPDQLDPFRATSYGTGELIKEAIGKGFKDIMLTIGGSATVDGGIGALASLGCGFYDKNNKLIEPYGNDSLSKVNHIDFTKFMNICKGVNIKLCCDVDNVLLGPTGSAAVFGVQKLSPKIRNNQALVKEAVQKMDTNLRLFNGVLTNLTNKDVSNIPGVGGAGGIPLGFVNLLSSEIYQGADFILDLLNFDQYKNFDVFFTCEGGADRSTLNNKAPYAALKRMKSSYSVFLTGYIESKEVERKLIEDGANIVSVLADGAITLDESIKRGSELLTRSAFRNMYSYLTARFR